MDKGYMAINLACLTPTTPTAGPLCLVFQDTFGEKTVSMNLPGPRRIYNK
jgi:hypothetical protein